MSGWHPEILGTRQRKVLVRLAPFCEQRDLYLSGGTALALQLGHRMSVDLDWFTTARLLNPLDLADDLRTAGNSVNITSVAPGTLHSQLSGVRVTVLHYRYRLLHRLRFCRQVGCHVAACDDIAAMKLAAITQRGARRDFVDLWALLESGLSLRHVLRAYQQKFAIKDVAHVLYALTYFDDADHESMPRMIWKVRWKQVKETLIAAVSEL